MPMYDFWCTTCCRTFTIICKYEDKEAVITQKCPFNDCEGHSNCEIITAGLCINKKKGDVNK